MKHNIKITFFLLSMFIVTQFIGIFVVNHYIQAGNNLPYGMSPPQAEQESDFFTSFLPSIIIAFIIAIVVLFLLIKFNAEAVLKVWFFVVVAIALGITFSSLLPNFANKELFVLIVALPLAFFKIFQRNFIVHNATELLIYPGIAAVFVPMLNIWTIIILLILISFYDMWAVWHSGIMQRMAKYQINKLKVFSGFFLPYASKQVREKIRNMKKSELKTKKIKVNLAILGGGDVIFPIITAGVALKTLGLGAALLVIAGATLGLAYLFFSAEKKKFYPAMPFITIGIFVGLIISYFLF
ncbi:MAG: presenilin family intramembrane aspartyl protease [Nanoarchaeota archaeon]